MVKVHHLNCLEIESPQFGRAIGHCLLIELKHRLILVDTGIGLLDTLNPTERIGQDLIDTVGFKFNEKWTSVKQIQGMGLDPEKVTDCIISHFDPDHIGGLADFKNATIHVSIEEYTHFQSGNQRYLQHQLHHQPSIKTYSPTDETWHGLEARKIVGLDEIEIYLIPLFGHTLGHCGVALKDKDNWLLYVGDAYYLREELTDHKHPVHILSKIRAENNDLRRQSLNKIHRLIDRHNDIRVFSYHDLNDFEAFVR